MESSWHPVTDENGLLLINGNNIVLENIHTKEIGYVENNEENRSAFSISTESIITQPYISSEETSNTENFGSGKIKWTHSLTKSLITKRLGKEKDFNRPKCKKLKLWNDIAREINSESLQNCQLKGEDCDNKYRNLLKTYKANKKKQQSTGESPIKWEYFIDFNEILGCKASIEPPQNTLFDTMEITEDSTIQEPTENSSELNTSLCSDNWENSTNQSKKTSGGLKKKQTLQFNEYLFIKNQREEEKEKRKAQFEQQRWEEEKEVRRQEINAILKLADALVKKV